MLLGYPAVGPCHGPCLTGPCRTTASCIPLRLQQATMRSPPHAYLGTQALPEDGMLYALDRDEGTMAVARRYWAEAGVAHKVCEAAWGLCPARRPLFCLHGLCADKNVGSASPK